MGGDCRWENLYSFAAARSVTIERCCPVITTPHRPVGCVVDVRYSARRPAASLRSRRMSAYLSWPTQPM